MNQTRSITACLAAAALLSACSTKPERAPAPALPAPVRQAPPPTIVSPPPAASDSEAWRDLPLAPGDWSYDAGSSEARYGEFSLRCDGARRRIVLSRSGSSGPLRLRTTYGERLLAPGGALPAADPLLDEIAFSRGRFTVEAQGMATLILPSWPEPVRVIEDCRG